MTQQPLETPLAHLVQLKILLLVPSSSVLYLPMTALRVDTLLAALDIGSMMSFSLSSDADAHDVDVPPRYTPFRELERIEKVPDEYCPALISQSLTAYSLIFNAGVYTSRTINIHCCRVCSFATDLTHYMKPRCWVGCPNAHVA
jgi:hypothetical protein